MSNSLLHTIMTPLTESRNYAPVILGGVVVMMFVTVTAIFTGGQSKRLINKKFRIKERYKAIVRSFDSLFKDLLPRVFHYETIDSIYLSKLTEQHDLTRFRYRGNHHSRADNTEQWLAILLKFLTILSSNVVMAIVYYPSNHTCQHRQTDKECGQSVKLNIIGSLCYWDASYGTCQNSSKIEEFGFILTLLFATVVVTGILDKWFKFTLSHAALAIKTRRMSWMYWCCLHNTEISAVTGMRSVRVAPADVSERSQVQFQRDLVPTALSVKPTSAKYKNNTNIITQVNYLNSAKEHLQEDHGQDPTLSLALEAAESGLEHFGDEWKALAVQSRKSTIMRAARFAMMKQNMDYVSAAQELQYMLTHSRERYLWMEAPDKPFRTVNWFDALRQSFRRRQLSWFHFGDPTTALELMDLAHLHHTDLIEKKLRSSRRRATDMRAQLMLREDGPEREEHLLRSFIAHSLCGHKRVVACAVLFDTEEVARAREARIIWQYVALFLVPAYFVILLGISFYGGLAVPAASTRTFILASLLSLALNLLWQQPTVIWLLHVWFPYTAKKDILALHWVLQTRARTILTRRHGLLHSVNALVQHFHPACRAARLLPHLPVSRLLLSLSDYDLPVSAVLLRPRRRSVVYPRAQVINTGSPLVYDRCEAICINVYSQYRWLYALVTLCVMSVLRLCLHGLFLLPVWAREICVEILCSGSLLGVLALIYHINKANNDGTAYTGLVVALVFIAAAVTGFKIYKGYVKEKAVLARLRMQSQKYNLSCTTFRKA